MREYIGVEGKTIGFINRLRDASLLDYEFSPQEDGAIVVNLYSKKIITGQSLADPRKNYQTTSAHTFTTKKTKLYKTYNSLDKAIAAFDKFRERVE